MRYRKLRTGLSTYRRGVGMRRAGRQQEPVTRRHTERCHDWHEPASPPLPARPVQHYCLPCLEDVERGAAQGRVVLATAAAARVVGQAAEMAAGCSSSGRGRGSSRLIRDRGSPVSKLNLLWDPVRPTLACQSSPPTCRGAAHAAAL